MDRLLAALCRLEEGRLLLPRGDLVPSFEKDLARELACDSVWYKGRKCEYRCLGGILSVEILDVGQLMPW